MKTNNKLCIYHGNCADGFGAAWVLHNKFGDEIDFHAGVHQEAPPDVEGKDVIIVDFSYKRKILIEMAKKARSIIILDHHKSAKKDLGPFSDTEYLLTNNTSVDVELAEFNGVLPLVCIFDMHRSGAMIAWDFYYPHDRTPELLKYIQDRDLWKFDLPNSRIISAALFSYPYDFDVWNEFMYDVSDLKKEGESIERKHFKDIHEFIKVGAFRMKILDFDVPCLNVPYQWSSDAGSILCKGEPFAACYWDGPNGRTYSLRSDENGKDVSEIASILGGGGHERAAGFKVKCNE